MKKFATYLGKQRGAASEFADLIGATRQDVSRWKAGNVVPSHEMMIAIEKVTKGEITIADWVRHDVATRAKKSALSGKRTQGFSQAQPQGI